MNRRSGGPVSAPVRTLPPAGGPPPALEIPNFSTRRLPGGLRVEVLRMTTTPAVDLRLIVEAGAGTTPPERAGLAALAADVLSEGAGGRSASEMAEWIDGLGASFRARTTYDAAVLSLHAMNDQLDAGLEYLAAVSREPDFAPEEVARRRGLVLDRLRRRTDEPAEIAADALAAAVFGEHPYGVPLAGTMASVERLEAADLRTFWSSRARPATSCLVICGDVAPDAAFAAAERRFGDWAPDAGSADASPEPGAPAPGPGAPAPAPVDRAVRAGELLLIDRPDSRQTELRLGGVGLARGDEREPRGLVMNAILGGLFNSRVNLNLREDKGWTYGARTMLVRRRTPGPFMLRTAVATEFSAAAFTEILAEFERLCSEPPGDEELALAVNALTLSLPLQFQTTAQLAGRRADTVIYGLPEDYWERFPALIRAVRPGEVHEAARRLLDPGGLVLLGVGDVSGFGLEPDEPAGFSRARLPAP